MTSQRRLDDVVERAFSVRTNLGRKARKAVTSLQEVLDELDRWDSLADERAKAEAQLEQAQARLRELKGLSDYDPAEVRAWARANKIPVGPTGRVPADIVRQWREATCA